ncbi:MAG: LysR family transcriptional regulator [Pseudomonadota bacterium]
MGQIEDLRTFVTVVDSGGIARAADALNIAKSAVSRRLALIEERYGVRLVDRQPRKWEVTTAGQELYQRAVRLVADADDLEGAFHYQGHRLKGPLTVSIAREFGLSFLKPSLCAFIKAHPEIDLTLDFDDRMVDLDRENYDMAVRITEGDLTGLLSVLLGTSRHALYCSQAYAQQRGLPNGLDDLPDHPLLYFGAARRAQWAFKERGKSRMVEFKPALNSNSGPFLLDAALNGLGIARLPDFISNDDVQLGNLHPVLPDIDIAERGIHLVYSANRRLNKRMRALIEALEHSCAVLNR